MTVHKRVFGYDLACQCLDCGAKWGALTGNPVEPATCVQPRPAVPTQNKYPAEKGIWMLVSPSGNSWDGDSPLRCVSAEARERIPPDVALARIFAACEPTEDEKTIKEQAERIAELERLWNAQIETTKSVSSAPQGVIEALRRLCALKKIKCHIEAGTANDAERLYYESRKESAWKAAQAALDATAKRRLSEVERDVIERCWKEAWASGADQIVVQAIRALSPTESAQEPPPDQLVSMDNGGYLCVGECQHYIDEHERSKRLQNVAEAAKLWLIAYEDELRGPSEVAPCTTLVAAVDALNALDSIKPAANAGLTDDPAQADTFVMEVGKVCPTCHTACWETGLQGVRFIVCRCTRIMDMTFEPAQAGEAERK